MRSRRDNRICMSSWEKVSFEDQRWHVWVKMLTQDYPGNHSPDHVQKIKPRVEQVCRELGLQYHTEHNEGRMYIDLQGGQVNQMPSYDYQQHHQPQHNDYGKPHYETAYPMGNAPNYSYAQAAGGHHGGYDGQPQMQYGGQSGYPGQPQQPMQMQEPQQKESKCCGLCVVM